MDEKELRIKNLQDIRECLIGEYGKDAVFKPDLNAIVMAIDARIRVLLEGFGY